MNKLILQDEHFFFRNIHLGTSIHLEPFFYENVMAFEYVNYGSIEITVQNPHRPLNENNILMESGKQIYCVVDTEMSINFGHFIWESIVFLRQLKRLKNKYPNIIFLIKNKTRFKSKIMRHYDFQWSDEIVQLDNYVGFLPPITALVNNKYSQYYSNLLDEFHFEVHRENQSFFDKNIEITYFPRHESVDNLHYENQDRSFNTTELQSYLQRRDRCVIYDTENSESWTNEINAVKKSKYIICHDGSSSAVLGFHAYNSVIIILSNNVFIPSMRRFDKVVLIDKKIKEKNERYYVTAPNNVFSLSLLAPLIERRIVSP